MRTAASRKQFISKTELTEIVTRKQADPGLREDLERLAGETTDELGPSLTSERALLVTQY